MSRTNSSEAGQALLFSLLMLFVVGSVLIFLGYLVDNGRRFTQETIALRQTKIEELTRVSEILNEIAINNQNILTSLSVSGNAFAEAVEIGLLLANTRPAWETRKGNSLTPDTTKPLMLAKDETSLKGLQSTFKLMRVRRNEKIDEVFSRLNYRAARGLKLANGYTQRNKYLSERLEKILKLHDVFRILPDHHTLCFALSAGFISSNRTSLSAGGCEIEVNLRKNGHGLWKDRIFHVGQIIEWNKKTNEHSNFGLSYAPSDKYSPFLKGLNFKFSGNSEDSAVGTEIRNSSGALWIPNEKEIPLPLKMFFGVAHPRLKLGSSCSSHKSVLTQKEWEEALRCGVDEDEFLRSFLEPRWAPLLLAQERQT